MNTNRQHVQVPYPHGSEEDCMDSHNHKSPIALLSSSAETKKKQIMSSLKSSIAGRSG